MCCRESPGDDDLSVDGVVEVAGQRFEVEVKSVVTTEHGKRLAGSVRQGAPLLVVADRIAADAKRSLQEAGSTTSTGEGAAHRGPAADHPHRCGVTLPMAGGSGGSLDSQVAKEVAICCLLTPDQPHGVRADRPLYRPSSQRRLKHPDSTARRRPAHLRRRGDKSLISSTSCSRCGADAPLR